MINHRSICCPVASLVMAACLLPATAATASGAAEDSLLQDLERLEGSEIPVVMHFTKLGADHVLSAIGAAAGFEVEFSGPAAPPVTFDTGKLTAAQALLLVGRRLGLRYDVRGPHRLLVTFPEPAMEPSDGSEALESWKGRR